jgi:hypothetical protein
MNLQMVHKIHKIPEIKIQITILENMEMHGMKIREIQKVNSLRRILKRKNPKKSTCWRFMK